MKKRVTVKKYIRSEEVILRASCLKYAERHPVTEAAEMYGVPRHAIYEWLKKYDGTDSSLKGPVKGSTKRHSKQELRMIMASFETEPELTQKARYLKLKEQGYTRSESGFFRICRELKRDPELYDKAPEREEAPYPPLRKVNEKVNPHKAERGDLLMPASCLTCEFCSPKVCMGVGTRTDNGEETYGMDIFEAMEMFPHGCDDWGISFDAYVEQEKMNGR